MIRIIKTFAIALFLMLGAGTAIAQTHFRTLSFDAALSAAKQEKKMVFIDFYTDWCGPCKMMARDVFPQPKVGDYFNARFVCLKLNAEKEGKELAKKYQVSAYPTYVVLDADGKMLMTAKGAMDADDFIAKIASGIDPERSPERIRQLYEEGKRTPEVVNAYALQLMEQQKETEGFKVVDDYFASLTDKERLSAANSFLFTRYTVKIDDAKGKFMVSHIAEFDPAVRPAVEKRMQQLFHSAVSSYFSGYMLREGKYDEATYQQLKQQIQSLRLDAQYGYAPMFELVESRVKDSDAVFLDNCERVYDTLDSKDRTLLLLNLTRLIDTKDKAMHKRMSTFIRSRLSTMDANTISLAGRILGTIER